MSGESSQVILYEATGAAERFDMMTSLLVSIAASAAAVAGATTATSATGVPAPSAIRGSAAAARQFAQTSVTQTPAPQQNAACERGTWEIGVLGGYGRGKVFDPQRTPVSFTQALVRTAFHFGPTGSGALRGNFAIVAEGLGAWIDLRPDAGAAGLNLLVRYGWATWRRWRPVAVAGAGILYSNERVPPGETRRNFTPQVGAGIQYLMNRRLALTIEYRYHHLSNNGATETNPGINSHLALVGLSWFH